MGWDGLDPRIAAAVRGLIAASGGRVKLVSGYRSPDRQRQLWNQAVKKYGAKGARKWVAPPGKSKHNHGLAVDLGGDLELAARLAPQFGLWRPMSHEPWHFELAGSRDHGDPHEGSTEPPDDMQVQEDPVGSALENFLASLTAPQLPTGPDMAQAPSSEVAATSSQEDAPTPTAAAPGGGGGIDAFLKALRTVESGGNYQAVGPATRYGNATGAYQFINSTWGGYQGFKRAKDAPAHVQDARARQLAQQYYNELGDWRLVAVAWHAGLGTARKIKRGGSLSGVGDSVMPTSSYADRVISLMGGS